MAMVIAADNNEGGSGEAVETAGNGGGGGDSYCAGCEGRGLAVIGVDGNNEDCGEDAGGGEGNLGYVGLCTMTMTAERRRMRRRKTVRPTMEQRGVGVGGDKEEVDKFEEEEEDAAIVS